MLDQRTAQSCRRLTVLCDMGANPDVTVDDMVRFAQMGAAYARVVLGIEHPRVGLLANGTEDEKAPTLPSRASRP